MDWNKLTKEEMEIIDKIVSRFYDECPELNAPRMQTIMDISAVHIKIGLRLNDLLNSSSADFLHDCFGIMNNISRSNGKLLNHFLPRFVVKKELNRIGGNESLGAV